MQKIFFLQARHVEIVKSVVPRCRNRLGTVPASGGDGRNTEREKVVIFLEEIIYLLDFVLCLFVFLFWFV